MRREKIGNQMYRAMTYSPHSEADSQTTGVFSCLFFYRYVKKKVN